MKRVLTDLSIMTLFWISVLSTSPVKHKNLSVTPCSNPDNLTNYCDIYRYRKTRIICTFTALQGLQMTWKYTPFNMKVETTVGNSSRGVQTTSSPCLCGDNYWNYTSTLVIANSDSAQGNTAIRCLGTVNNTTQEVVMKIGASYERIALPEEVFQDNSFTLQCLKTSFKMEENTTLIKEFRLEKYNSTSDKYEVILVHSPKFKNCSASSWQLCQENGTIGLVRNKTNAVCSDAGLYRCSAITSKNITFISPSEYLRVLDRPRILAYKIVPCESIGCSNVTLVCVAKGPLLMHINWLFPKSKWDESAKQFTAALGQSDCGHKLYMVTSTISLPEKHLHDLPTCSVAYEDEFTSYDQRSSELDDEDTMVKNIILEYQSHLIINCTQKWFHLTNFSMTTLSVAKQNSDGHREERARINLDSNKSLVTTATNWSANQTQIYGNVALQVTKVNVTCLDDGLYLCLATFYHNQTKAHQELFQSFLIDVVDRRVETNQPLIQTKQCPSQQVCCVEQNQTINVTCSVNTTSMSELQLLYPSHDAENVRRKNQTELNVREKSMCPVHIKTSDMTIVSVQTDKVITCQILEARSEVKIMVLQKQSMPNIFATQCPQESRCSVIRNSKVQLVCSLKTRATPLAFPLELYYMYNNEEISIAEMPSKIEVSKASIKFNQSSRSECAEYFLQYNLTIQSLESSTQFKCKYFSWTSSVVVTVSKHEWTNTSLSSSFSILWLIPIIFGPLVISILAGVLHVLFLKKTIERKMSVSQTSIVVSSVAELPRIKLTKGVKSFIPGESAV